jgi:hypothetical protein
MFFHGGRDNAAIGNVFVANTGYAIDANNDAQSDYFRANINPQLNTDLRNYWQLSSWSKYLLTYFFDDPDDGTINWLDQNQSYGGLLQTHAASAPASCSNGLETGTISSDQGRIVFCPHNDQEFPLPAGDLSDIDKAKAAIGRSLPDLASNIRPQLRQTLLFVGKLGPND